MVNEVVNLLKEIGVDCLIFKVYFVRKIGVEIFVGTYSKLQILFLN